MRLRCLPHARIWNFEFGISNFPSPGVPPYPETSTDVTLSRRSSSEEPRNVTPMGAWVYSGRRELPAPSTNHNQPRRPFITPTSRKVAAGPARRGFPRAGGRGGGNRVRGRWPARMQPAGAFTGGAWHPGRVYWRCLASRHDVVLNVMSACLAPHGERFENGSRVGVPGTSREECAKPVRTRGKRCSESPWSWAPGCRPSPPP
jgi:hypothetical protein